MNYQFYPAIIFYILCYSSNNIVGRKKSEYTAQKQIEFQGILLNIRVFHKKMCHPMVTTSLRLKEEMVTTAGPLLLLELSTLVRIGIHLIVPESQRYLTIPTNGLCQDH